MNLIEIGVITKPQGLQGQVRAKLYDNDASVLQEVKHIYLNKKPVKIMSVSNRNTFVVLKLEHINHIDDAEKLRHAKLFVEEEDIVLQEDEFLVKNIIGWQVATKGGVVFGVVKDIANYGAGDIYTVAKDNGEEFMFVNANDVVQDFDEAAKRVIVDSKKISEMSV